MSSLKEKIKSMPDAPGVYIFYTAEDELVYVGRATSLRNRVKSYFQGRRLARPIEEMIHEVTHIKWQETESVIEAVILEAIYIKKFQPKYNVLGKDSKSWNYFAITKDEYPRLETIREHDIKKLEHSGMEMVKKYKRFFGPYPGLNMRAAQKILRRLFRVSYCEPDADRPCLYYEMGQCPGVCVRAITAAEYKKQVIKPLTMFLSGRKQAVIKNFRAQMKKMSAEQHFEEAGRIRDQIEALQHIHDMTLIDHSFFDDEKQLDTENEMRRIEGYDISNLGSSHMVGSMVVFTERGPKKSEYRKFNIKGVLGQSDVDSLAEVIERRFNRQDWQLPDIVLIDGGRPQVNRVKKIFEERGIRIPFVGIAKGRERKRNDFILGSTEYEFVKWVSEHRALLINVRDEAHRFAITFNRSKRKIKI